MGGTRRELIALTAIQGPLLVAPRVFRAGYAFETILGYFKPDDSIVGSLDEVRGDVVVVMAEEALLDTNADYSPPIVGRHLGDSTNVFIIVVDDKRSFGKDDRAGATFLDLIIDHQIGRVDRCRRPHVPIAAVVPGWRPNVFGIHVFGQLLDFLFRNIDANSISINARDRTDRQDLVCWEKEPLADDH